VTPSAATQRAPVRAYGRARTPFAGLVLGILTLRTGNVVVAAVLHDALDTLPI
jgi:hypothetical protein